MMLATIGPWLGGSPGLPLDAVLASGSPVPAVVTVVTVLTGAWLVGLVARDLRPRHA